MAEPGPSGSSQDSPSLDPDTPSRPTASASQQQSQQSTNRRTGVTQTSSFRTTSDAPRDGSGDASSAKTIRSKPTPSRRPSSKALPHRGQGFSTDDASDEVDGDAAAARQRRVNLTSSLRQHSTLRRRPTISSRATPFLDDTEEAEEQDFEHMTKSRELSPTNVRSRRKSDELLSPVANDDDDDDDDEYDDEREEVDPMPEASEAEEPDMSDAESFTLKDRQEAINETHPFGIRIWKPALYKKGRSVEKEAEGDIHSSPGGHASWFVKIFNFIWTLCFGWWLALIAAIGGTVCYVIWLAPGCRQYGRVFWGLARYLFYPFGKYVKLLQDEAYAAEDEGEGRSISEYVQWQSGDIEEGRLFFGPTRSLVGRRRAEEDSEDDEQTALLGRGGRVQRNGTQQTRQKRRLFGRGNWSTGRVIFFVLFYGFLTPLLFLVSGICWLSVFYIPMGRVTLLLFHHLRRHPLALEFHSDSTDIRGPHAAPSSILVCTYRAAGLKYWKYTVDGTNIILINLLGVVVFVIFDYYALKGYLGLRIPITDTLLIFLLALFSIIPLAYFIGQAVASISAQSTMGVGAAINAFFSTIVEVFLYCVALKEGKASLVEGSIIGSIFAGILLLPGLSMLFGALKRKTLRFNVKSAGVTSTMLLFAVIGAFGPTLFYQIYGAHEINCHRCTDDDGEPLDRDCRRCFFSQVPAVDDPFYVNAVRPFCIFAAVTLFLSYCTGLAFTLKTHAATIWNTEIDEKKAEKMDIVAQRVMPVQQADGKPRSIDYGTVSVSNFKTPTATMTKSDIRESQLYKRILGQSLRQVGLSSTHESGIVSDGAAIGNNTAKTIRSPPSESFNMRVPGFSEEEGRELVRQMAEMAATAAAVAARDATQAPKKASMLAQTPATQERPSATRNSTLLGAPEPVTQTVTTEANAGGHDAPNWSTTKSYAILMIATVAYAIIAEILVSCVDAVLESITIEEKFLGLTLLALVPNTTEFLNAISFAMNQNIALSMEIGSAYALQVCLLQIPALVFFSVIYSQYIDPQQIADHTFLLLFPQWDLIMVILCVFLLSYVYGEGKANYFKGIILILSYLVVIVGFYFAGAQSGSNEVFLSSRRQAASMTLGNIGPDAGRSDMREL